MSGGSPGNFVFLINTMLNIKQKFTSVLLTFLGACAHAGVVVIANPSVRLEGSDVHDVYLGEKQFIGATKLVVVDNSQAQEAFLAQILKLDVAKYKKIWAKKAFQEGINPPEYKSSDMDVYEFVKRTPGAIGYTSTELQKPGVNVIK